MQPMLPKPAEDHSAPPDCAAISRGYAYTQGGQSPTTAYAWPPFLDPAYQYRHRQQKKIPLPGSTFAKRLTFKRRLKGSTPRPDLPFCKRAEPQRLLPIIPEKQASICF